MSLTKKLRSALKKAGLPEGLSEVIKITSEDQIEGIVTQLRSTPTSEDELDFKKVLASTEFTAFIAEEGVEEVLKASKTLNREFDKKVGAGVKTFKQKFVKDELDEDDNDGDEGQGGKGGEEMPAWAKTLIDKVDKFEKGTRESSKLSQAQELFSKSKILKDLPEKLQQRYLKNVDLESDTSLENQIKEFESEASELSFSKPRSQGLPVGGQGSKEVSDEEISEIFG